MAVEILVRLYDGNAGRRSGDFISVKQVPHAGWGLGEGLPNYSIINVDGIDLAYVENFAKRHVPIAWDVDGSPTESVRSMYRLDIPAMKNRDRADLMEGLWLAGLNDVNAHIINRIEE